MRYYKVFQIAILLIFNISCLLAQEPQHFTFQSNTGNTGSIVVPMNTATIDGVPLSEGDEIGALLLLVYVGRYKPNTNIDFLFGANEQTPRVMVCKR